MSSTTSTPEASAPADDPPTRDAAETPGALPPPAESSSRSRGRRGLTLVEILVAVALLVAFTALVIPAMLTMLDEGTFEGAGEVVASQMLLARAAAQETGRPVEVIYRPDTRALVARWFTFDDVAVAMTSGVADRRAPTDPTARSPFAGADDEAVIAEPWARRPLPGRVTMTDTRPLELLDEAAMASPELFVEALPEPPAMAASAVAFDTPPIRVAVYLPDGSVLVHRDVWLRDDTRIARITVNPFTGRPDVARLQVATSGPGEGPS